MGCVVYGAEQEGVMSDYDIMKYQGNFYITRRDEHPLEVDPFNMTVRTVSVVPTPEPVDVQKHRKFAEFKDFTYPLHMLNQLKRQLDVMHEHDQEEALDIMFLCMKGEKIAHRFNDVKRLHDKYIGDRRY